MCRVLLGLALLAFVHGLDNRTVPCKTFVLDAVKPSPESLTHNIISDPCVELRHCYSMVQSFWTVSANCTLTFGEDWKSTTSRPPMLMYLSSHEYHMSDSRFALKPGLNTLENVQLSPSLECDSSKCFWFAQMTLSAESWEQLPAWGAEAVLQCKDLSVCSQDGSYCVTNMQC
eukprot:TRINITY_DN15997_c0_g1_i3.p1 TRINITY_DN15997_c0_g1~~TRINITY_DN15997_c0_g1_i3.p1  ORF type:complete len:173 (+),score=19.45 TRINITY_DN15997_c0_g1_i3:209-727(+)